MTLADEVRGVTGEMVKIQQLLRRTSPAHAFSEEERRQVQEYVSSAEGALKRIAEGVRPR